MSPESQEYKDCLGRLPSKGLKGTGTLQPKAQRRTAGKLHSLKSEASGKYRSLQVGTGRFLLRSICGKKLFPDCL